MKKINISQIDTLFVNGNYPIEFLFYYKNRIKSVAIRKALKKISTSFWPLFGEYTEGWIQSVKYAEDKFLKEVIYNEDFISTNTEMEIWEKYHHINPENMIGLFHLSILQFNNGTVLIPKLNHLAGDGYSYFYFLAVLAALSKSSFIPFMKFAIRKMMSPKIDRIVLMPFHFDKNEIEKPFEQKNCTIKIEKVRKESVTQMIKMVNKEHTEGITANDILSAIVLKKTFDLQKAELGNGLSLATPIDVRRRVNELGKKFLGNGLMFHYMENSADELDKMDISQLSVKLRQSMPSINREIYARYLNDLGAKMRHSSIHSLKPYNPGTSCLVTNLSRMPIDKLDFGSGSPDFIFLLTIGRNSTAILADKNDYLLRLVY